MRRTIGSIISKPRAHLIRADALKDYKHFEEALIEAEKARDHEDATAMDREFAKGKIVLILGLMRHQKQDQATTNHVSHK